MNGWSKSRLADCCEIVGGSTPSSAVGAYWGGTVCWATPKDLSELGSAYISDTPRKLTEEGLNACGAAVLPPGSVLFSSRAPIGHVAVNTVPMATNQGFKSLIPKPDRVDAKFLYWWLRAHKSYLQSLGNGATFKEVSKAVVSRIELPIPSLPEQRRIADILDRAEALRGRRRAARTLIEALSQALFVEMFCGSDSRLWPDVPVEGLAADVPHAIRTGPFGSQLLHSEFVASGIPVLGIDNAVQNRFVWTRLRFITESKYRTLKRYTVRPGDVLVTIMGTCGRCAVVPDDIGTAINTKHLCCITLNKDRCLPVYLHACLLRHPRVLQQLGVRQRGAVMPGLNMQLIKHLRIPDAPLSLQREYEYAVAAINALENVGEQSSEGIDSLFASLQHRAFRGEL